ncbi:MAG: hypothetical protein RLZZ72_1036 [Actinomycetota bacterium]
MRLKRGSLSTIGGLIAIIWFASIFSSSDAPQEIASSASPTQTITQSSTPSPSVTESPTVSPETKSPEATKPSPSGKPTTKPAAEQTDLQALITQLVLAAEQGDGYDRDLFRHWIDADGDGCNTRREVLIAEAKVKPSVFGDCDLTGGEWYSVYDQVRTNDPSDFDVDHFIPLKEAWDSGAYAWSSEKRKEFANDLGFGGSLIAVTASSNRSKSDRDPADWLPPNSGYHCRYITNWVKVKIRWGLTVDSAELATIKEFGNSCK